jgi:uncharacterized protein (DUF849 family)
MEDAMNLFDEGKIMIRVAVNEMQRKEVNPHIPYGADEVAAASIECARAGASIVHFHSRTDDGAQAGDDDRHGASIYRRALELVARESDIIMEPTNLKQGNDPSLAADTPHFWSLLDDPPANAQLEVVNIDGFRFARERAVWDETQQRLYVSENRRIERDLPFVGPEIMARTRDAGLVPFFGLFDLAEVRTLSAFAQIGIVDAPVFIQINFFWDILWGPSPTPAALDAFVAEWNRLPIDTEMCMFVRGMPDRRGYESLLEAAIDRGIHLRVGLGDNPQLFPTATNADMVEHAVEIARRKGLTPVTPEQLRARMRQQASATMVRGPAPHGAPSR